MTTEFSVQNGDVTAVKSDLLLLKYAASFHGADRTIAHLLTSKGLCSENDIRPCPDEFCVVETKNTIAPLRVMFLGTPGLSSFDYAKMRDFAQRAIDVISDQNLPVKQLTTTIHGVGYGLDAGESLQSLVKGFQAGFLKHANGKISKITFVERSERTTRVLLSALEAVLRGHERIVGNVVFSPDGRRIVGGFEGNALHIWDVPSAEPQASDHTPPGGSLIEKEQPQASPAKFPQTRQRPLVSPSHSQISEVVAATKKHVFVAMPFSEDFQDTYEFGIYAPVRQCGFICEKVDETSFTGDILKRITDRIASAEFVIADLTSGRANVYLEVGYAWGKGVPVIFLAREGEKLHFDVSTHRCIYYRSIRQLAKELEKLIRGLYG